MSSSSARSVAVVVAAATAALTVGFGSPVSGGSPRAAGGATGLVASQDRSAAAPGAATAGESVPTHDAPTDPEAPGGPDAPTDPDDSTTPETTPEGTPEATPNPATARPQPEPGRSDSEPKGTTAGQVTRRLTDGLPGDRPNIVVIMADDMRDDELAWMPNVRRLITERGVRFTNSFSPYPLCCPARASFLTGEYTHNHGVWTNDGRYGLRAFDDTDTVATRLAAVGYQTAFLGKYLNGYGTGATPSGRPSFHYVPPGWSEWRGSINRVYEEGTPEAGGTYSYFDTTLNVNGTLFGNPGVYQTRLFGRETEEIVSQLARSPRPFFLWASYVAPHAGGPVEDDDLPPVVRSNGNEMAIRSPARPRDVRGIWDHAITRPLGAVPERDMSDKPGYIRENPVLNAQERRALLSLTRQRAEALYVLDQQVERTVQALREAGELEDTVLVFTSDNGYLIGEHGELKSKRLAYESSIRVPTVMAGPGIPRDQVRRDPFLTIDFEPTFLDIAGAPDDVSDDGISLWHVARHGDRGWSRAVFTESGPMTLPDGRESPLDIVPAGPSALRSSQGVRTSRYLYVEHATRERELYDLQQDPLQLESVVDDPARRDVVAQLAAVLDRLRMCKGTSCEVELPRSLRVG